MQRPKKLFTPVQIGHLTLKHRIVLPPLSRLRAHWPTAVPSELMRDYYRQRASLGGLIMAEGTAVSSPGRAYHTGPGLWNIEQIAGWKRITDAVHDKGGFMFVQLTHAGRATSSVFTEMMPVSASENPQYWENKSVVVSTPKGFTLPSPHRALELEEIRTIIDQYRAAAGNAKQAGFDGIEILAGQAHLIEQFLHDSSNKRTDEYGGSFENRERLLFEILEATTQVWDMNRIGVRISPSSIFAGMGDSNASHLYRHLAQRLNSLGLAYLHIIEPRISGADTVSEGREPVAALELRKIFHGPIIAAGGFTPETAEAAVTNGIGSLISFGRYFTSNPDLPYRIANDLPLTPYDRSTFYAFDAHGYTDWPDYRDGK
ncbi:MAG: alkene reductase [Nitrospira sp.]|nr:alkene reductase [Nitrospira sp.]